MFESDPWAYLVRFRLEAGGEVELKTDAETYKALTEGASATLTWQEDTLISFT